MKEFSNAYDVLAKFPHSPILHYACGSMYVNLCLSTRKQQKHRIVPQLCGNLADVFTNDVLTCGLIVVVSSSDLYGLLYTGREIFVIMSSGDEGKQRYLLIQLFYVRNYETDFGRVRLQITFFCNTILL